MQRTDLWSRWKAGLKLAREAPAKSPLSIVEGIRA
jgi:hypothetical protein